MSEAMQPSGIRGLVMRGFAWKASSQLVAQGSRIVVAVVLARMLSPHDFGVAAMVLVVSSLVLVFGDLALGAAIVQRKELSEAQCSTAFWCSIAAGAGFTLAGIAVAGPVASFYGEAEVKPLLTVLSFSFLIASLAATHEALLVRNMEFRAVETRRMIGTLVGAVFAVIVAVHGGGPSAVIAGQLATSTVTSALLVKRSHWRARFTFSGTALRNLGGFSIFVLGHRLLYYLHRNADNLLIGRVLGATALGVYALAYNIILIPFSRIGGPVAQVMFPAFSRLQDQPERIAALWLRGTRVVGAITVPALCGLVVVAPDFVRVVLGERWAEAVPVIQILAWVGLLQSLQTLNSEILQARDRTSSMFAFSIGFFCAHLAAFVIGLHWGVIGVATAYAISSTLVEPIFMWLTARAVATSPLAPLRAIAGVAQASVIMGAAVFVARELMVGAGAPAGVRLALCILLGVALYLPLCLWREPELSREVSKLRSGLGRRVGPLRPADSAA
jgi:O-antigen/teichoic acid export membrane protein